MYLAQITRVLCSIILTPIAIIIASAVLGCFLFGSEPEEYRDRREFDRWITERPDPKP